MGFVAGEHVAWTRWWGPEQVENRLFNGVLPDPRDEYTRFINRHVRRLKDFAVCRALVLLGDPGTGKSSELETEINRRRTAGEHVERILLGDLLTADEVRDAIQSANVRWRAAGAPGDLTLALDGFDEPLFALHNLAAVLERELERLDRDHLRVLITSRRSAWRDRLSRAFARWWPGDATGSLVLAPLTERDIRQAAATELDDPDGFVSSLKAAGVLLLAASPMTLRLLLVARLQRSMPSQRHQIYALGMKGLAAEANAGRMERGQDDPPLDERLAAARRLAAVGLLSGRSRVIRRSQPVQSDTTLALNEVADTERDLEVLQAVFTSALLTDGGTDREWTHRSIQEFLTAQQCEGLPLASVRNLLADPAHPDRILPQLAGVAAWLAALRADVVGWLAGAEPEVLVQADLQDLPEPARARVAEEVVMRLASAPVPGIRSGYAGLLHTGLGAQLAPLLASGEPAWRQQEAALIIRATGVRELDGPLMDLLERAARGRAREDYDDRIRAAEWAARALYGAKDPAVLDRAKCLAADAARPWPVRAELLPVLWPQHVDMSWLLETIAEADRVPHSPMGRRVVAMLARVAEAGGCSVEDLEAWAASLSSGAHGDPVVRRMLSRAVWAAVAACPVGSPAWRAGGRLLDVQWAANRALHGVSREEIAALAPQRRRQLVKDLVQRAGSGHVVAARLHDAGLLRVEDLDWWLDDLRGAGAQQASSTPAFFAVYALADAVNDEEASRVAAAAGAAVPRWHALAERFTVAARAERTQLNMPTAERWSAEQVLAEPQFAELMRGLQRHAEGVNGSRPVPAWPALTSAQQHAVAERAVMFLCSGPNAADEVNAHLIETACQVVTAVNGAWLDRVPVVHWLRWLPGLWDVPGGYTMLSLALQRAIAHDEDATLAFLTRKMRQDAGTVAFHQRHMKSRELSSRALANLSEESYPASALAALLDIAAAALPAPTAERAFGLLQANTLTSSEWAEEEPGRRETAVTAGGCLAACPMSADVFDGLLTVLESDHALARDIIYQAHHNASGAWSVLTAPQRGRLYQWAHHALPRHLVASGRMVRSDPAEEFPSQVLGPLLAQSSMEHAAILEELADETGSVWLRADAARMREAVRSQAWRPPTAAEVREVLTAPSRRIIGSVEQLAAVMAETLEDIGNDLRADRALRAQLWHRQRKDNEWIGYVPVEEREVSTWLARELKHRLAQRVAVLREVEINPRLGDITGDIPDLLAVARTTDGQLLSVPGEVKCSWHKQVVTALRDQLGHRYLAGPSGTAGVYVAVHFSGSAWDDGDSRRLQAARHSVKHLREDLRRHATALATHGIIAHVCVLDASLDAEA
ncbi:NACHT domain-containing protein [Streptomyces hirsutus]